MVFLNWQFPQSLLTPIDTHTLHCLFYSENIPVSIISEVSNFCNKKSCKKCNFFINPFSTNVPLLYSLKPSENLEFSDVFRGYRSG